MELAQSGKIAIYGVNYLDERDDAIRWLDYFGDPFEMSVYDHDGRLGAALGLEFVPGTYLLGDQGRILYRHVGPLDEKVMEQEIWPRVAATKDDGE
jgi:cytochrome c biogenesis protein CcmG/thiol:disulfide interchange protein DsbE